MILGLKHCAETSFGRGEKTVIQNQILYKVRSKNYPVKTMFKMNTCKERKENATFHVTRKRHYSEILTGLRALLKAPAID